MCSCRALLVDVADVAGVGRGERVGVEAPGEVERVAQPPSPRMTYQLTEKGEALRPVLMALKRWAVAWSKSSDAGERPAPRPIEVGDCSTDLPG